MIRSTTKIFMLTFLSFLFGCQSKTDNGGQKSENIKLEDISSRINPEEGFKDVYMKIIEDRQTSDEHIYLVKGLYKNRTVGLQISVSNNIGAGIIGGKIDGNSGFVPNGASFTSIGEESDEFVKALAELYEQPCTKGFTKNKISVTTFSLNESAVDLNKAGQYKLKLFFEENDEDLYSELFLNINTKDKEIELSEKDFDYRAALIKVFTK